MPQTILAQQGSHKLHRHWPPDFADSVHYSVWLLISLNVISISNQTVCISLIQTLHKWVRNRKASVWRFLWQSFVHNSYLLRLKISLAWSDEHDEKLTHPTSDFFETCDWFTNCKKSRFFEVESVEYGQRLNISFVWIRTNLCGATAATGFGFFCAVNAIMDCWIFACWKSIANVNKILQTKHLILSC